ncbi:MAG: nucleoside-diphosphate sugar epimerase/dehydratase [Cloacibacillus sp.]
MNAFLWLGMRNRRVFVLDLFCLVFAVYAGFSLRLSYFIGRQYREDFILSAVLFAFIVALALLAGGTYRVLWPRASVEEYAHFARWYALGVLVFLPISYFFDFVRVPRSAFLFMSILGIFFLTVTRAVWRLAAVSRPPHSEHSERALIIGAGEAGTLLARDLMRHGSEMLPIGFIDDNPELRGMAVASLKVLGGKAELADIIKTEYIDTILIAMPSATGEQIKEYLKALEGAQVKIRVLPSLLDLADGQVNVSRLRSVNLEDLLRREPIHLDCENISALIKGKTVLVTGAGGSIGSEICRQALSFAPEKLLVLGHGEQSIYLLLESLADAGNKIPVIPIIADVADEVALGAVFDRYEPCVVFHAAAHKHVPLMEYNPREALRVNGIGTWTLASMAGRHSVERFVMISTDKAVHPTSVMGATKRAAERLILAVQQQYPDTKYMAVRFGNVLGSRGSVVPKFERQIAAGGPVTVTDPEMKRYFMLIPEAVSLVLQAGAMGTGGELFVLDMGEPVKISEMAETLIRLHGYEPGRDIKIEYSGVRPGEKLYEELFYDLAHVEITGHKKIFKTKLTPEKESILPTVQNIVFKEPCAAPQKLKEEILALGCDAGGRP